MDENTNVYVHLAIVEMLLKKKKEENQKYKTQSVNVGERRARISRFMLVLWSDVPEC